MNIINENRCFKVFGLQNEQILRRFQSSNLGNSKKLTFYWYLKNKIVCSG